MTQSQDLRMIERKKGESDDAFDARVWQQRAYIKNGNVFVKATAVQLTIIEGAKHSGAKVEGRGNLRWYGKFASGIMIEGDMALFRLNGAGKPIPITVDDLVQRLIMVDAMGKRGSGSRVPKRFPEIAAGWRGIADVFALDDDINEAIFADAVRRSGLFCGLGQHRPQNRGTNGRFSLEKLEWEENVKFDWETELPAPPAEIDEDAA